MNTYYMARLLKDEKAIYAIWYTDEKDGLLVHEGKLLTFDSADEARQYSEMNGIALEADISEYDLTGLIGLASCPKSPEVCSTIIDCWNLFSDLAQSLGEPFMGDKDEGLTNDIYTMLFYGTNLKVMKHDEYLPDFDEEDTQRCREVLQDGLSMLERQLGKEAGNKDRR